jgi:hypothetical protein
MIVKPNPIPHVDVAVAERAFEKVPGLVDGGPATCLPIYFPLELGGVILAIFI